MNKFVRIWQDTPFSKGRFTHSMPCPCRSPAIPCRSGFRKCLSHLIYTVRPCLIHTCHAAPIPCSEHAVFLKATWWSEHGIGMASVNQTRQHRVNQMGKTYSKPLAVRHGRRMAWARHGNGMLCVNLPLSDTRLTQAYRWQWIT